MGIPRVTAMFTPPYPPFVTNIEAYLKSSV